MPLYESVVVARQDISAAQVDTLADELTKIIEENGGSVAKREHWGLRSLTYRIKKNRKGHYMLFNVDAPAAALSEFERRMRLNEDILRYLSIRVDEHEEGQSSILTNKGRPPGRRDGGDGGGGGGGGGRFESGRGRPPRDDSNSPETKPVGES